jgi:hypothetical protein
MVAVVHRIGPLVRTPYWLDEAWVALSAKAGLMDLPTVSASTPIGWTFLVSLIPPVGQVHRLLPLAFLAGSVITGYALARLLGWGGPGRARWAGALVACAVLLLPAQQSRHDLKQYTADAAVTLLVLALLAWAEAGWTRGRAAALGAAIVGGMLVSHAAALVGGAVLAVLAVGAALRGWWRRPGLRALLVAAPLGMGLIYITFDRSADNGELATYWADYFPTVADLPGYLDRRLTELRPALGAPWPVVLLLAAAGVFTAARLRRPATAATLAVLPPVAVAAGLARVYPLLDQRTSHWLLVALTAAAAIGLAGATTVLGRRVPIGVALGLAVAVLVGFAVSNRGVLLHPPPAAPEADDAGAQARYVATHRRPDDAILVSFSGQYAFAYYWSADRPRFVAGGNQALHWYVRYPDDRRIVIADGRDPDAVRHALARADALAGPTGRVWLVRSHVALVEQPVWDEALRGRTVRVFPVGPEPLALLDPP